jgi:hypothetical protein
MGSLSDNGDGWPSDGGSPDDLPDLPEEWGVIVIPDDLSELSDEVRAIQAELRVVPPRTRWQRLAARPAVRRLRRIGTAALRAPVLIISMAVLVTVASLFASAWSGPTRSPATQRTANTTDDRGDSLPVLDLLGADGQLVPLRGKLPAVVLITDGCDCARLVADTIGAVRADIAVVTVTSGTAGSASAGTAGNTGTGAATENTPATGKAPQAQGKTVRALRDPTGGLRASLHLDAPNGTATALLVNLGGEIVRQVAPTTVADLRPALALL